MQCYRHRRGLALAFLFPIVILLVLVGVVVLAVGSGRKELPPTAQAKPVGPFVAIALLSIPGAVAVIAGINSVASRGGYQMRTTGNTIAIALAVLMVIGSFVALIRRASYNGAVRRAQARVAIAAPLGYTPDGQPIYPVVGYTPDGSPVTADRAPGVRVPGAAGTNGLATAALICAFFVPVVGAILGFVARSQIARTGQDGSGLALAAIVIGVVLTIANVVLVLVMFKGLHG